MFDKHLTLALVALLLAAPLTALAKLDDDFSQKGVASYYADSFHGRRTASGETYDKRDLSAAHKYLPLGARVRVTRLSSGKSVVVTINDRGPFVKGRIIDLSRRAARELGILRSGLAKVRVDVLSLPGL